MSITAPSNAPNPTTLSPLFSGDPKVPQPSQQPQLPPATSASQPTNAAPPPSPEALQQQITALQAQVNQLQQQLNQANAQRPPGQNPATQQPPGQKPPFKPRNGTEAMIADVYRRFLGRDPETNPDGTMAASAANWAQLINQPGGLARFTQQVANSQEANLRRAQS